MIGSRHTDRRTLDQVRASTRPCSSDWTPTHPAAIERTHAQQLQEQVHIYARRRARPKDPERLCAPTCAAKVTAATRQIKYNKRIGEYRANNRHGQPCTRAVIRRDQPRCLCQVPRTGLAQCKRAETWYLLCYAQLLYSVHARNVSLRSGAGSAIASRGH